MRARYAYDPDTHPHPQNRPVDGYPDLYGISSGFGGRDIGRGKETHYGVDYAVPEGTTVRATMDGKVANILDQGEEGFGKYIVIEHADKFYTLYAHLSEFNKDIKVGDVVKAGQEIGKSGHSGGVKGKNGDHLHYEISKDGYAKGSFRIDPEIWHNPRKNY